jgi:DNA polymerase-3 subunit gamma/tau
MTYQVLARKWRPRVFEELVGQSHVVTALTNALHSGRLHHAYLFTGTRGVGKTTLARILAKAINCETGITSKPCGKCRACIEIDSGRFVDLLEVDAATNTKVDEMRELLDTAQYMPAAGRFKVYIIDEVHMLSKHAFNSMLKTLEEPPEHVKFILATTDPQRLPVTVLSRCLQFNLKPLPAPTIAGHLRRVLDAESIPAEDAALQHLGKAAAGSVRDSLSLLDQAIAHGAGKVTAKDVSDMLGTLGGDLVGPLLERVADGNGAGTIEEAERIAARSISFDSALEEIAALLHRVALTHAGADVSDDADAARVKALAAKIDPARAQVMYQIAILARRDLPLAPDEFAGFSMALLRMLSFGSPQGGKQAAPRATQVPAAKTSAPVVKTEEAPKAPVAFDGDWPGLVQRLNLPGLAGMVARHAELVSFANNRLELAVPEAHRLYAEGPYPEKLRSELAKVLGSTLRLTVRVGETAGTSVAAVRTRESEQRRESAAEAIEADPFVRELVRDLGAEVVPSSIKPADEGRDAASGAKGPIT